MKKFYLLFFCLSVCAIVMNAQVNKLTDLSPIDRPALKSASAEMQFTENGNGTTDCTINALILHADYDYWAADVKSSLMATGKFDSIGIYDFRLNPNVTLADLQYFDAAIVWTDYYGTYPQTGQALKDYMDQGGGVVTSVLSNYASNNIVLDPNYAVVSAAITYGFANQTLNTVFDPTHPIMKGVSGFSFYNFFHSGASLNPSSTLIADWDNGQPLVSVRENIGVNNARAVDINMFAPYAYSTPDAVLLMANSLLWVSQACECPSDITVDNDPGVCGAVVLYNIPSASGADVNQIDTTGLKSGNLFPIGVTPQAWELDFGDGIKDTCSFTVTVVDAEAPVIDCPGDTVVSTDQGECHAVVNYKIPEIIAFSDTFIQGQAYTECDLWLSFCSQLLSDYQYTRLTMKGTYDPDGVTLTDPAKIQQIANALREGVFLQVSDTPKGS